MQSFTEGTHPTEGILSEAEFGRSRDNIVIVAGSGVIKPMTVVHKNAEGKYEPATAAHTTGLAIAIYGGDATTEDLSVAGLVRSCQVKAGALNYHVSVDDAAKRATKATQLAATGIIARATIG